MISTYREDLKGPMGLNELHVAQVEDRLEYRGKPKLWYTGRLYDIDGTPRSSPVQFYSTGGFTSSGTWIGGDHGQYLTNQAYFVIDHKGQLSCYGNNGNSWLGLSGVVGNMLAGTWSSVKAGGWYWAGGILSDSTSYPYMGNGTLKTWGYNNSGQLGQGDTVNRSSPTQIPGQWRDFYPYANTCDNDAPTTANIPANCFALTYNDQLWAWGANTAGMFGLSDGIPRSSPVQIPGVWKSFQRMSQFCLGVKSDNYGRIYSWGQNNYGQLGLSDVIPRSSPTQIYSPGGAERRWKYIVDSHNMKTTFAFTSDGQMWGWGYNAHGELGQGDVAPRSSPCAIPGAWENVIAKDYTVLAWQQGTGILYGWGQNNYYQLGHSKGNQSRPTPIPGKWDSRYGVWFNGATTFAVKRTRQDGDFQGLYGWGRNDYGQGFRNSSSGPIAWPIRTSFFPESFWSQRLDTLPSGYNWNYALWSMIGQRE